MDASGLIIGAALGGIEGGAKANSQRIAEEAEYERKLSYQKLIQQYGKENMEFQDRLAGARQDKQNKYQEEQSNTTWARDRQAKEDDAIVKRAQDLSDWDRKKADTIEMEEAKAKITAKYREGKDTRGDMGKMFDDFKDMYGGDEEKARMAVEGVLAAKTKKTGQLTEYQQMRAEEKLAELEDLGISESNINQVNALRSRLDMAPLEKVVVKPGSKGFMGVGSSEDQVEYRERTGKTQGGGIIESAQGKPADTKQPEKTDPGKQPEKKTDGIDKYLSELKPPEAPANTDIGSILGTITNGGVAGVKAILATGKTIFELDQELVAASRTANASSKSAIMEALKKVREVMATETDPVKQINAAKIKTGK